VLDERELAGIDRPEADAAARRRLHQKDGKPDVVAELEHLIGGTGHATHLRLRLPVDSDQEVLAAAAAGALARWQQRAENPLTGHELAMAARVAVRSCEGILAELHGAGDG